MEILSCSQPLGRQFNSLDVTQATCNMLSLQVHTKEYVHHFNAGTLGEAAVRRIGFGEVTRQPILIERTKAEVAGRPTGPQSSGWHLAHCFWA